MSTIEPLHILMIEDDLDTQANLRDILEMDDHRVESAGSAAEALARGGWSTFSAIILDRRLPDATADELLPKLRRAAPDAAVIVVTGDADLQGAVSALRQGASDYILKPIDPVDLRARLKRIAATQATGDELKRQAELIRLLLADASDAILVANTQGKVSLFNPAAERLLGPMKIGDPPSAWPQLGRVRRGDAETAYALSELPLSRALRQEYTHNEEIFIPSRDGKGGCWMSVNAGPILDEGRLKGAVVFYRDITERKGVEEELRRQRDLAEGLIAAAPAVVLVLDEGGRILRFNRYAEQLSGFKAEEVLSRDFFGLLLPERDRVRLHEIFVETLRDADTSGMVNPILTRDGRERDIRWSNRVLRDKDTGTVRVLAIGQDVTDLKDAQERALRAERLAAIGQVVTGLAHESRNALQRSQACLEMLALKVEDRPEALDLIDRIQKAQDHLHLLYEDVRGYASPIRLERRECDLAAVWREAWAQLESLRQGRQALLIEACDLPERRLLIDPFRIGQVFRNVLENALAACPDPAVITLSCSMSRLDGTPALRVTFRDNGPGFSAEERLRIFEPFYTTKTRGTGLGMAISRRIIEAHGGRIAAGDSPGPGAEIQVTLPRRIL